MASTVMPGSAFQIWAEWTGPGCFLCFKSSGHPVVNILLLSLQTEAELCVAPGASTKSEEAAVNKINEVGSLFSLARRDGKKKNRRFLRIPSCDSPLSIHGSRLSPWNILIWCLSLKRHDRTLSDMWGEANKYPPDG